MTTARDRHIEQLMKRAEEQQREEAPQKRRKTSKVAPPQNQQQTRPQSQPQRPQPRPQQQSRQQPQSARPRQSQESQSNTWIDDTPQYDTQPMRSAGSQQQNSRSADSQQQNSRSAGSQQQNSRSHRTQQADTRTSSSQQSGSRGTQTGSRNPRVERNETQPSRSQQPQRPPTQSKRAQQKPIKPVKQPKPQKIRRPMNPENYFWIALPFFFAGIFLLISCISHTFFWQADQNLAEWDMLFVNEKIHAHNWGGRVGAILSADVMGILFGIFGMLLPIILIVIGLKILRIPSLRLHKTLRSLTVIMLVGSLAMGHFFGINTEFFGSGLGGEMGIYSSQWLQSMIGNEGTTLLIIVAGLAIIYLISAGWIRRAAISLNEYFERRRELRDSRIANEIEQNRLAAAKAAFQANEQIRINAEKRTESSSTGQSKTNLTDETVIEDGLENTSEETVPEAVNINGVTNHDTLIDSTEHDVEGITEDSKESYETHEITETIERDENIIDLDNGQVGYVFGADADGVAMYYYLDMTSLPPRTAAEIPSAEPVEQSEEEEEQEEEIEFIIKTRHPEDEESVSSNATGADAAILLTGVTTTGAISDHASFAGESSPNEVLEKQYNSEKTSGKEHPSTETPTTKVIHFAPSPDDPNFIIEQTVSEELVDDRLINLTEVYDPTLELRNYVKPPVELLKDHSRNVTVTNEELVENKNRIVETLANFGIEIKSIEATTGPTVTLYEIIPAPGVRISKIKNLEEDIALSLSALGIRIIAPIPGKGTIGIEVPNKDKEIVSMYSVIKSSRFQDSKFDLPIALGKNIQNETVVLDLAKMPHLLVAGATGQGKSVGLNAIITSLLYKKHPAELKFVLVDPKKVELTLYSKLEKHFLAKMPDEDKAIITDTQKVIHTLNSVCIEMSDRYDLLEAAKVRNFKEYNEKFTNRRLNPEKGHRYLPYFVVIIDEFADLIMTAGREVETPIARIAQLARAVGIHLIIATQRPSVNIITGVIRANFPARIAFRVATATDSRTILDTGGANQLVGQGDMLVSSNNEIIRVQCAFIDTPEVDAITEHISSQKGYPSAYELPEYVPEGDNTTLSSEDISKRDSLFEEVAHYVVSNQSGSASTIQRKFSIGFNRAGRIIDQLEAAGVVGKSDGSKPRQVLISDLSTLDIIIGS